ncbi:DUF4864 domain-containing protein [Acuticoccus sp. MNP-M23]|uniref:DUF4864 domain-containing protein n=1 Tax=Acuticoccus sp. MNP-M23 TaxID=3072793 RepID=UPI002814D7A8|nr:DUF4864 domain-containing protein [Acuticoccus sp. MNP-M23]WMS40971.1 DUF4864 domain-containing protein [Acuticoccus sp. MNP-M23]
MKRPFVALALTASFALSALFTALPASADPQAVKETISRQLAAFRAGDAEAAYALAAPQIKRMFPSAERFITMVRRGYPAVYGAGAPVFLRTQEIDTTHFAQEVALTDSEGAAWTALYTLALQEDGSWQISGCYLKKATGQSI